MSPGLYWYIFRKKMCNWRFPTYGLLLSFVPVTSLPLNLFQFFPEPPFHVSFDTAWLLWERPHKRLRDTQRDCQTYRSVSHPSACPARAKLGDHLPHPNNDSIQRMLQSKSINYNNNNNNRNETEMEQVTNILTRGNLKVTFSNSYDFMWFYKETFVI